MAIFFNSLKINFKTIRIHAYFDIYIAVKIVILKKCRIFSLWLNFPQICSQTVLGPGNSVSHFNAQVSRYIYKIGAASAGI
jgi:hypothetical protein